MALEALTNLNTYPNALGGMLVVNWTYPTTVTDDDIVIILRKRGSAVLDSEIDDYFDGTLTGDIHVLSAIPPENDITDYLHLEDGITYHYAALLAQHNPDGWIDRTPTADAVRCTGVPEERFTVQMLDVKQFVYDVLEDVVLPRLGLVKDKDVKLSLEMTDYIGTFPTIVVSRENILPHQEYLGRFIEEEAQAIMVEGEMEREYHEVFGSMKGQVIRVMWTSRTNKIRDKITMGMLALEYRMHQEFLNRGAEHGFINSEIIFAGDGDMWDQNEAIHSASFTVTVLHEIRNSVPRYNDSEILGTSSEVEVESE